MSEAHSIDLINLIYLFRALRARNTTPPPLAGVEKFFLGMTYKECIEYEKSAPSGTIRLVACNKFYRAFNHSAWLFQSRIAEYKVVRRYIKALDAYVYYVGFPKGKLQERVDVK